MPRASAVLAFLAVVLTVGGSVALVIAVGNRTNYLDRWSFIEVVGYPLALIVAGLLVTVIARMIGRVFGDDGEADEPPAPPPDRDPAGT